MNGLVAGAGRAVGVAVDGAAAGAVVDGVEVGAGVGAVDGTVAGAVAGDEGTHGGNKACREDVGLSRLCEVLRQRGVRARATAPGEVPC